jgi:hypothetical protein
MENLKRIEAQKKLKELLESFDKSYIKQMFIEGEKLGLFGPNQSQNFQYIHEGYKYLINRQRFIPYGQGVKFGS